MSFGQRELKSQAAPGDACADEFSDTSSTLVASTTSEQSTFDFVSAYRRKHPSASLLFLFPKKLLAFRGPRKFLWKKFGYQSICSTKKAKSVQRDTFCFFRLNGSDGRRTLVPEKQGVSEANGLFRCGLYARIDSRRLHHVGMDSSSIPIFLLKIVISAVIPPFRKMAHSVSAIRLQARS